MYSFGAMLSFTIAHASVIALRRKQNRSRGVPRPPEPPDPRARPAALRRLRRARHRDRLGRRRRPVPARALGGARLARGRVPLLLAVPPPGRPPRRCARPCARRCSSLGPSLTVEYRTIVVPVKRTGETRGGARRRRPARGRARRDRRDRPRDRGAALAPARREAARGGGRGRGRCSTTRRRSSRATASVRSRACSARGAPGRRSSRRHAAATPSSSSWARRATRVAGRPPALRRDGRLRPPRGALPRAVAAGKRSRREAQRRPSLISAAPRRARRRRDRAHRPGRRRRRSRPHLGGLLVAAGAACASTWSTPLMPRRLPGLVRGLTRRVARLGRLRRGRLLDLLRARDRRALRARADAVGPARRRRCSSCSSRSPMPRAPPRSPRPAAPRCSPAAPSTTRSAS